jgi:hypothetical protein
MPVALKPKGIQEAAPAMETVAVPELHMPAPEVVVPVSMAGEVY